MLLGIEIGQGRWRVKVGLDLYSKPMDAVHGSSFFFALKMQWDSMIERATQLVQLWAFETNECMDGCLVV